MFTSEDVAEVRHVVQRILVPCVFVIGLLGNSVSIYVLTRKRMRCTTNIYLTALAITDIFYLAMALLLSLQHYEYIKRNCEPFWMYYGIIVWLCDACAYISIYIAVCFTIERFIAIRYPLKRQKFCTESLAKKVITGVALFCLLSTISTAFEHQSSIATKLIDSHGRPCNLSSVNAPKSSSSALSFDSNVLHGFQGSGSSAIETVELHKEGEQEVELEAAVTSAKMALMEMAPQQGDATNLRRVARAKEAAINIPNIATDFIALGNPDVLMDAEFLVSVTTLPLLPPAVQQTKATVNDSEALYRNEYCQNVTYYTHTYSSFAQNTLYIKLWYFFTLFIFVLIPLCVLATFNCFLIMLVRRSKSLRGEMTNASSIRKSRAGKNRKPNSSVSQENRVTVTLIAVVLLFIVCQLPWAIYLIVSEQIDIEPNLQAIIGNIFNFLAAINAAANFFLYCVLSDKYRKTVRELITGYRYKAQRNTLTSASLYTNTTANGGSRRYRPPAASSVVIK